MIAAWVNLKVKEGHNAAFEELFRQMAADVRAGEPGCVFYQLFKSRTDPRGYSVVEIYADQAAQDFHRGTDHLQRLLPQLSLHLDGKAVGELLDGVV